LALLFLSFDNTQTHLKKKKPRSFGVLLWELLTKKEPFGGENLLTLAFGIKNGQKRLEVPLDCPTEYAEIMKTCWAERASNRPSFRELNSRLDAYWMTL
jgi:hypothetical protein